jgi:hypothetical protein
MPAQTTMKIQFLHDFQGVETNNKFYKYGQVVTLDDSVASRLVADKRAVSVEEKQPDKPIAEDEVIMPEDILTETHAVQPTAKKRGRR